MRAALTSVVIAAAVAACGGGTKPAPTIENTAVAQAEPWTLARVRATLPADASLVVKVETAPVRTSEVLGSFWTALADRSAVPCPGVKDLDLTMLLVAAGSQDNPVISVWMLDTSTQVLRTCLDSVAASPPPAGFSIAVDGDFVSFTGPKGLRGGLVFLDDRAAFMTFEKTPSLDRARVLAATHRRDDTIHHAELDELYGSTAPIWGFASGTSPMLGANPITAKFRTAAVTVGLATQMSIDARVRMVKPDEAATTAQLISGQGQSVLQMGMATELTASAEGDALVVHAAFTKASLDKVVQLLGGFIMSGSIGLPGGPTHPFGP